MRQPLGTVKSWVRRALMTLKSCLQDARVQGATSRARGDADMDYGRSDLADAPRRRVRRSARCAARARRRFESLLPAHAVLREATRAWQERLMPLTAVIAPVQPSGEVWRRISDRTRRGARASARAARGSVSRSGAA